jgi:four helix bundle protein
VWQEAHQLRLAVYRLTRTFPADERYDLVSQMRRAAVSIGGNIAEGFGRWTAKDRARFLEMARSSALEVADYLILSLDLSYMKRDPSLEDRIDKVSAMLWRARQSILGNSDV